ncbi:outer membrane beta-barrel protein [Tamlana fucoidanivorans]|uniref:outer membrane beta-barrel protein n=1 Tax=Allotamlana fucoidanivorans TaxID=2583814 RepID=UPI001E3E2C09|nr:outer membrane beta-barrel protein [Tamlana fucoidanivorans]
MNTYFFIGIIICFSSPIGYSQSDTSTLKAQFALGVNSPSSAGFVTDFEANSVNFPSINLGLQYMFWEPLGVKLDFGYNRFSSANNSPDFKVNYTRINGQLVFDASHFTSFLNRMGAFVHVGPGVTMIKPLGNYGENKTSYLNTITGLELHYAMSDKLSVYLDASYIVGFSDDFDPVESGFGSFNGNMFTLTIGASISLSGCYYCGD